MKKYLLITFTLLLFLSCSTANKSIDKKIGFTELDSYKSSRYNTPSSIKFIFVGKSQHEEYFNDLKERIIQAFSHTKMDLSFKFSNSSIASYRQHKENDEYLFFLEIVGFKSKKVNTESNILHNYYIKGYLQQDEKSESKFFFDGRVSALNDKTSQNNEVVKYLFSKIFLN